MLALPSAAAAHDYWFERDGDAYLFMRGHRFSEHDGAQVVPYDPKIVSQTLCVAAEGSAIAGEREPERDPDPELESKPERDPDPEARPTAYPVRVAGPCAAVYVHADSGYWSQTLTGTTNQPPEALFGVLRSWHALESAKLIESWSDALARPVSGHSEHLEIISETDPFGLEVGRKLRLLVMRGGKPVQGVAVAYNGDARGVTGADGRINIRVRHGGAQRITASIDEPLDGAEVDKRVRSTALFFELPEPK